MPQVFKTSARRADTYRDGVRVEFPALPGFDEFTPIARRRCGGEGKREITAEEIMDNWSRITSLDGAKPLNTIAESFAYPSPFMK